MISREFLGWSRPFVHLAADWLLARPQALPEILVIVPTSQSARALREALAEKSGALLSPRMTTPGALMAPPETTAQPWEEQLAWMETLGQIDDWSEYAAVFPEPPEPGEAPAAALALELTRLRLRLQENGHSLASTARFLAKSPEADRWAALARLEAKTEKQLAALRLTSRTSALARGIDPAISDGREIVLAGVANFTPLVEKFLTEYHSRVTALIPAPEDLADSFSAAGRPLDCWTERELAYPAGGNGGVYLEADARAQAAAALRSVAAHGTPNAGVAICAVDPEATRELERAFDAAGWPAFVPEATAAPGGLRRWLETWSRWLAEPRLAVAADLLGLPETAALVEGRRVSLAASLARFRNAWPTLRPEDFSHRVANGRFREQDAARASEVDAALQSLLRARQDFMEREFPRAIGNLLERLAPRCSSDEDAIPHILDWCEAAEIWTSRRDRKNSFWLPLMLQSLPEASRQPPEERAIDISGWLELLFEPGPHLILCGANDGLLPSRDSGDPWLGESTAKALGLSTETMRWARDAFLFHSIISSRLADGRSDVFLGKSAGNGAALIPSRLLLATSRENLPTRVDELFRPMESPDAGLRWEAKHHWRPTPEISEKIRVTGFSDYLACPFRFYLKHVLNMQTADPSRCEWNSRDFGNIIHAVLEAWALDPAARELRDATLLRGWLHTRLDHEVSLAAGSSLPLALHIQKESAANRLAWFAREQAVLADEWEVMEAEKKFSLDLNGITVTGKIDRIDRHRSNGALRVIDYKTGSTKSPSEAHTKKNTKAPPAHLPPGCPAFFELTDAKGKSVEHIWTNLQLPLYAAFISETEHRDAIPCFFNLSETEHATGIKEWQNFDPTLAEDALECARWISRRIKDAVFWPPAEAPEYDDFAQLTAGRTLAETCLPPEI